MEDTLGKYSASPSRSRLLVEVKLGKSKLEDEF